MAERINWNEKVIEYLKQMLERIKNSVAQEVTTDHTVVPSDDVIVVSGTSTVSLLALASAYQKPLTIINIGTDTVTITPNGSEKINGESSYQLTAQYESVTLFPSSTEWNIISKL